MEDSPTPDGPRPASGHPGQPAAPPRPDRSGVVRALAEEHLGHRGAVLPVLHDVVDRFGWVDATDVPVIADVLNLSRADVHGVVSFYADFRTTPPPEHRVTLCRGEACQAVGAQGLFAAAHEHFAGDPDVEVTEVFCLGNCALGPSGTLDGRLHGRLSLDGLEQLTQGWSR